MYIFWVGVVVYPRKYHTGASPDCDESPTWISDTNAYQDIPGVVKNVNLRDQFVGVVLRGRFRLSTKPWP